MNWLDITLVGVVVVILATVLWQAFTEDPYEYGR